MFYYTVSKFPEKPPQMIKIHYYDRWVMRHVLLFFSVIFIYACNEFLPAWLNNFFNIDPILSLEIITIKDLC